MSLNKNLIEKAIGFHGLPLQKIWEGERGDSDLARIGIINPDYSIYLQRQKNLTFQDRAKRFKLHQLISKKAESLYDINIVKKTDQFVIKRDCPSNLPPFVVFSNLDLNEQTKQFFETLHIGDFIYGQVSNRTTYGVALKVLFSSGSAVHYVPENGIKAYIASNCVIQAMDKKSGPRNFTTHDFVCCMVTDVQPDSRKIICTMKSDDPKLSEKLGLITSDDFPNAYKIAANRKRESYDELFENCTTFNNPACIDILMTDLGLQNTDFFTNMSSLKGKFSQQEYAIELRQVQASKWAFRSVAEGIEHFKEGRHSEAFQCLNKALNIDPRNVEGLVARGALYANSGSFKKAVEDFEMALKLNPAHANARKYMGETLVALGRSFEEETKIEDAKKAYQDCLNIIPHHEEAQNSLDFLKSKSMGKQIVEPAELELPDLNIAKSDHRMDHESMKKENSESRKDKKNKKDKKRRHKKRRSSSSDSSSNSSESSESSSDSSSSSDTSSSSGSSNSRHKKKKRTKIEKTRQKSLSPLSKRMAIMSNEGPSGDLNFQFNQPFTQIDKNEPTVDEYEMKVRKFLEMPRDEEDYEDKVRRFVAEAAKYQKERKLLEEKTKKKKKKEERKAKKESKKKRKSDEKKRSKGKKDKLDLEAIENKKIRDALKIFESLPVLDELGTKLTEYYAKVDKSATTSKDVKEEKQILQSHTEEIAGSKWKMMFAKDERGVKESTSKSAIVPKQYAFGNDSEESENCESNYGLQIQQQQQHSVQFNNAKNRNKRRPATPPAPKPKDIMPPVIVKSGPVVLDKFGNFRLAITDQTKPPEPPVPPRRNSRDRSRSKSRRKYGTSSSRSRSRSLRRRSRSGSYRRKYSRSRSRSYNRSPTRSRSYSRSRSRSHSPDRRRNDRRAYRGRGGYVERGTYYKPRYGSSRGGRNRGGFRDFRDFRGRGRDRPFRPRIRGGSRFFRSRENSRERRRDSRSQSFSPDGRPHTPLSGRDRSNSKSKVDNRNKHDNGQPDKIDIEGRWADKHEHENDPAPPGTDINLEEMEKFLEKARKDKKEDMLERNKDILKNKPF